MFPKLWTVVLKLLHLFPIHRASFIFSSLSKACSKHQILETGMWLCGIAVLNLFSVIIYDLFSYFLLFNLSTFYWCMFSYHYLLSLSSFCDLSPWTINLSTFRPCLLGLPPPPHSHVLLHLFFSFLLSYFSSYTFPLPTPLTGVYSGVCAAVRVCAWIAVTLAALALLGLNNLVPVAMWTFSQLPLPNPLHLSPSTPPCKTAWKHKFAQTYKFNQNFYARYTHTLLDINLIWYHVL